MRMLVSMTTRSGIIAYKSTALGFSCAGALDDPINLRRSELVGAAALGIFPDQPEHFRFGGGKPHIIPDAEKHRLGCAALFDNERAALIFHPTQQPSKIGTRMQCGDDNAVISAR